MKIAFDGRNAEGNLVGIGKYTKNLVEGISQRGINCRIFYSRIPKYPIKGRNIQTVILSTRSAYYFEQILLPVALKKNKVDIYHATANGGVPLASNIPLVLTIHDIIPIEDRNYFKFSTLPEFQKRIYFVKTKFSCWKAKKIITLSNHTRAKLAERFNIEKTKVEVIRSGVSCPKGLINPPKWLQSHEYVLNNGGLDTRKNLKKLILAFRKVLIFFPKLKLVITGDNPMVRYTLTKIIRSFGLERSVHFTGYVSEHLLWQLIKSAKCICYPSLFEGFGLPVLEGFCAGVPVISSNISTINETAQGAALLINPEKNVEISDAILKILIDKKFAKELIKKGLKVSTKYNWENTIEKTLAVYEDVLK